MAARRLTGLSAARVLAEQSAVGVAENMIANSLLVPGGSPAVVDPASGCLWCRTECLLIAAVRTVITWIEQLGIGGRRRGAKRGAAIKNTLTEADRGKEPGAA